MSRMESWRLWSIGYLLSAALFFLLAIFVAHRGSAYWAVVALAAFMFLVKGARLGPPK
jgi:hypothetical protein